MINIMQGVPFRILVTLRIEKAIIMRTRENQEWRLDLRTVVDKHGRHDASRLPHPVDVMPRGEILVPVPRRISAEALFGIQTALMQIHIIPQQLADRVQQAWEQRETPERLGIHMRFKNQLWWLSDLPSHVSLRGPGDSGVLASPAAELPPHRCPINMGKIGSPVHQTEQSGCH